jgi:nickel-type superoxide dismutase maturation protease
MSETGGGRRDRLVPFFLSATAAALTAAALRLFERRFARYLVTGASMEPTLHDGDWLIVDLKAYARRPPEAGHVVVARDPREPTREIIKRIERFDPETALAWLAGDNALESTDSRHFGPITPAEIVGQVRWRYWHGR